MFCAEKRSAMNRIQVEKHTKKSFQYKHNYHVIKILNINTVFFLKRLIFIEKQNQQHGVAVYVTVKFKRLIDWIVRIFLQIYYE